MEQTIAAKRRLKGELKHPVSRAETGDAAIQPRIREQRRHPRVQAALPLQVNYQNGDGLLGEVVNVSLGGLLFRAEGRIEPGTAAEASFELVNRSTQVVCSLEVSVAWCEPGSAPDCYWVGCRIVDMPFFTKVWLEQFISGRLTSPS